MNIETVWLLLSNNCPEVVSRSEDDLDFLIDWLLDWEDDTPMTTRIRVEEYLRSLELGRIVTCHYKQDYRIVRCHRDWRRNNP